MSAFTTFAEGLSVAGVATAHVARSVSPDVCKTESDEEKPFPNYILTSELGTGQTVMTMLQGAPIWTAAGILDATPSLDAHEGVNGGVNSGTYQGIAEPNQWATTVLAEGNGMVCMDHVTYQNNRNTDGVVDDAANLAAWLAEQAAANAAAADAQAVVDGGGPDDDAGKSGEGDEGDDVTDEQGEEEEAPTDAECFLERAFLSDGSRAAADTLLEIVGANKLSGIAKVKGECPDGKHPAWTCATGSVSPAVGEKATIDIPDYDIFSIPGDKTFSGSSQGISDFTTGFNIGKLIGLMGAPPRAHTVTVEAHQGPTNPIQFTVSQYPVDKFAFNELPKVVNDKLTFIKSMLEKIAGTGGRQGIGGLQPGGDRGGQSGFQQGIVVGTGKFSIDGGWKEWSDHRAFFGFNFNVDFQPLLEAQFRKYIPLPPPFEATREILEELDIYLGPYVQVGFGVGIKFSVGRQGPEPIPGAALTVTGTGTLTIGADLRIRGSIFAEVKGSGGFSMSVGLESPQLFTPLYFTYGPLMRQAVAVTVTVATTGYFSGKLLSWVGGGKEGTFRGQFDAPFRHGEKFYSASGKVTFFQPEQLFPKKQAQLV